jgi:hypothetical protein
MNERLARIAMVSLVVSVTCLLLAAWSGGLGYAGQKHRWWLWSELSCKGQPNAGDGRQSSVNLAWDAGDRLDIDLPAVVDYRPGPKAEAVISGDSWLLQHVRLAAGRLGYDVGFDCFPAGKLAVQLTGPAVTNWRMHGSGRLSLSELEQDALDIGISGSGSVIANGTVRRMLLHISGSGSAEMSKLALKSAELRVSGSGEADIAPQEEADIHISGSGNVLLHGHPARIQSRISGSGRISEAP